MWNKGLTSWWTASLLAVGLALTIPSLASAELPSPDPGTKAVDEEAVCLEPLPSPEPLRFNAECDPDPCTSTACDPSQCPPDCDPENHCAENACYHNLCDGGGTGPGLDPTGGS